MGREMRRTEIALHLLADFVCSLVTLKHRGLQAACRYQALIVGPEAKYCDVPVFSCTSNIMPRWYLEIGSDRFLQQPFELPFRRCIVSAGERALM
jgi:hypothetical protein